MTESITVFVGDITADLRERAISFDNNARLITGANFRDLDQGTYYTSVGDLDDLGQLGAVLRQADIIVYSPPETWSNLAIKTWTEDYLEIFSCISNKKTIGFESPNIAVEQMSELVDHRRGDGKQIWIAGCSISHGYGVLPDERWGL